MVSYSVPVIVVLLEALCRASECSVHRPFCYQERERLIVLRRKVTSCIVTIDGDTVVVICKIDSLVAVRL